jgi:hypothetical protein
MSVAIAGKFLNYLGKRFDMKEEEKIKMTLIQGDCLKVLPTLPDESVDSDRPTTKNSKKKIR